MHTPITGIVAEYNPLHLGHRHHMDQARALSGAEGIVVVLSSNFVQRGEPALISKWERARAALDCGADLVLELPLVFSAHNAGVFANAAVDILAKTGIVTHISFGVESPEWQMDKILDILIEEPQPFKFSLKEELDKGSSFVESRAAALDRMIPGTAEKLKGSNNSLALSYMLRIKRQNWKIDAVPVKRLGSGYHENELTEFSSATAVRKAIAAGKVSEALSRLPDFSAGILNDAIKKGRACTDEGKLWNILRAKLISMSPEEISNYAEIGEGIEYLLREKAIVSSSFTEWGKACTSRRYPLGRIQRHAVHILIGLEHWTNRAFQRMGPPYIRVLGMNENGRKMLKRMRKTASLPVVTRCGAASSLSDAASKVMRYELIGSEIWEQLVAKGEFGKEHSRKIIISGE
ncbi:MAG TPA: nucleotidyltransferase family protein [Synergistaceae bacterium]|jgi:predicted nucleotidyltransferase|nr:nucleotidyltransferase family protein [Synergistaceae bacterium]NLL41272.1 nucleotidyltransferase family protein [Synergistaceae bacterium]HPX03162.1 nucleotidyltransferase family protein [Synergistaceae bacterium]HQA53978.1 nucleotidyltransferase family protein [Synergistaceae bacterium]